MQSNGQERKAGQVIIIVGCCLFIYLLIYLFIYLFTYLFIYLLIYLFIYLFIFRVYSFIALSSYATPPNDGHIFV